MDAASCIGCGACQTACPKEIGIHFIAMLNRDLRQSVICPRPKGKVAAGSG